MPLIGDFFVILSIHTISGVKPDWLYIVVQFYYGQYKTKFYPKLQFVKEGIMYKIDELIVRKFTKQLEADRSRTVYDLFEWKTVT